MHVSEALLQRLDLVCGTGGVDGDRVVTGDALKVEIRHDDASVGNRVVGGQLLNPRLGFIGGDRAGQLGTADRVVRVDVQFVVGYPDISGDNPVRCRVGDLPAWPTNRHAGFLSDERSGGPIVFLQTIFGIRVQGATGDHAQVQRGRSGSSNVREFAGS